MSNPTFSIVQLSRLTQQLAVLVLLLTGMLSGVHAEENGDPSDLQTIKAIQSDLKNQRASEDALTQWTKSLNALSSAANRCIEESQKKIEFISKDLAAISEPLKGEATEVTKQRDSLSREKQEVEKTLANCQVRNQLSQELLEVVSTEIKKRRAKRLFAQGPTFSELLLKDSAKKLQEMFVSTRRFFTSQSGLNDIGGVHALILLLAVLACVRMGVSLRLFCRSWAEKRSWTEDFSSCFHRSVSISFSHYAPYILPSLFVAAYIYVLFRGREEIAFVEWVVYGLPLVFLINAVIRLLLWPPAPAVLCFSLPSKAAQSLARRLELFLILIFVGYLLFSTLLQQSLPEHTVLLTRGVYAGFLILNLIWITRLLGEFPTFAGTSFVRLLIQFILVAVLVSEWSGYRNFSFTVLVLMYGSLVILGVGLLVGQLLQDFFDGLEQGRRRYHRSIRRILGLKQGEELPGQLWFRFVSHSLLWITLAWVVLVFWGFSQTLLPQILLLVREGFTIGSLKIVPSRILLAVLTFSILILINSWFKSQLENKWVTKTRLGLGARETVVTMGGYIGVALAILVTLGVAGITFTNVAIIAGALSVGIGFGLQNVVNNFVSGLILLFERPVKTGDWIVVGNTEGYVKRIRIRSTQIQTFDRADVIVPNSELISGQVTNWMLYDTRGRIRVPIGVAYGTDTEKVQKILLEIAQAHPSVAVGQNVSDPKVLFLGFGESSLDFELRCFIFNIDERTNVVSDINFAIDKAFRENSIEIPFPQRDIHIVKDTHIVNEPE
ncbi:MAG: mechanosensitive ion channel [Gammaproteobacteria bacterium]|nr:mechanosensitive ion channel [Gammaproteobacteria bacterium]MDH5800362.1 mechanosensitive ion channel [Gammaproteobacteria bacterium]